MQWSRAPCALICGTLALLAAPNASAQYIYQPASAGSQATGENYNIEFGVFFWSPSPEIVVSSEALGIVGTSIDLVADLAIEQTRLREFRLVLRPGTKHKLRFHYLPAEYIAQTTLQQELVFNGIRYDAGLEVDTRLKWTQWRLGYEYDLVYRDLGYFGIIVEAKYTDVDTRLAAAIGTEFTRARAPVPTVGAIGRVYLMPNIAVTGEFTGFSLPKLQDEYDGHFYDYDIYGTVNFTNEIGAQVGYRSMDLAYRIESDSGTFKMKGFYFGGVVRF
jgi:hypothetical protein